MELSIDDPLHVNPDVVFRDIDGEAVLLHLERGTYFGLDAIGTRVWHALVEHGCVRPAVAALLDEFDVAADRLEADLRHLLADLRANDLVRDGSGVSDTMS